MDREWVKAAGWVVCAGFYLFDLFLRLGVDVVTDNLQKDFDTGAGTVSSAFASSFYYAYAVMQVPTGVILDLLGTRTTMLISCLLTFASAVLFSFAETVAVGTIARVIGGVGAGTAWLGSVQYITETYGPNSKTSGRLIGITTCVGAVGGLISQAPFEALVHALGWRGAFRVASGFAVVLAVGAAAFIRKHPPVVEEGSHNNGNGNGNEGGHEEDDEDEDRPAPVKRKSRRSSLIVPAEVNGKQQLTAPLMSYVDKGYGVVGGDDGDAEGDGDNDGAASKWAMAPATKRALRTPHFWMLVFYLGGVDPAFETLAGVWGVQYLKQTQDVSKQRASLIMLMFVLVYSVMSFALGAVAGWMHGDRAKVLGMAVFSAAGTVATVLLCALSSMPLGLVSFLLMLVSSCGGGMAIVWVLVVRHYQSSFLNGIVNTFCIVLAAVCQMVVGMVLDARWEGEHDTNDSRVYPESGFREAFIIFIGCFVLADLCCVGLLSAQPPPKPVFVAERHMNGP